MVSYAQNHEDVVLARALPKRSGFYIDVGAGSPVIHSVTNHFYQLGWRGINVEPAGRWYKELRRERPEDINLQIGLSNTSGVLEFYDVTDEAAEESTFSASVAESLRARGLDPKVDRVPVNTLAVVCEEYVTGNIDFLKVDVEGLEFQVLAGGAWDRFRPTIVVVESTYPGTSELTGEDVVALMEGVGYCVALFDGINRFYVQNEDNKLRQLLRAPANVLDEYEDIQTAELRIAQDGLTTAHEKLRTAHEELAQRFAEDHRRANDRIAELEEHIHELVRTVDAEHQRQVNLIERLALAQRDVGTARREESDARIQFEAAREALERAIAANVGDAL